jgi:hypothetical protein
MSLRLRQRRNRRDRLAFCWIGGDIRSLYHPVPDQRWRDCWVGVLGARRRWRQYCRWLAEHVGSTGSVLATDIDPRFVPASELPQLEVARHDVTTGAISAARYDLIHARLVLSHLPQRRDVLARLVQALGPGGWLVVEDFCGAFERGSEPADPVDARYRKVHAALDVFLAHSNDNQSAYATMLPQLLASLGLADVGGEGRVVFGRGGSPAVRVIEAGFAPSR